MNSKANMQETILPQPWYRIGMVWLMIALPTFVVVASLSTAVIAYKNAPIISTPASSSVKVSR